MDEKKTATRADANNECYCFEPGPEKIKVEQVLGAGMEQRVLDFTLTVPAQKPDIEQIVDVYVKDVDIDDVTVIRDKVIVRGDLEVKVMYVADLPNQPVHSFHKNNVRWTRDIVIEGAEPGMKCAADVSVEFVDYDFDEDEPREVDITIVLKVWARVTSTTEMDVYALNPIDMTGEVEYTTASQSNDDKVSASQWGDTVTASQTGGGEIEATAAGNIITGPMMPSAGMPPVSLMSGVVTGNNVNVRTGPGTNFPSITKVNKGTTVTIKDEAFGWYKVVLPDGTTTGWIASWLVSVNGMVTPAPKG
ncbi:SH3, type 3 domain protein [Thermosinus carboxydivorans Nor1]|uniref:SH3, type 3 domain protein n=1 Tax=Thermosinus carboxydivorans Nor1 TaxID=401526 RepID=A1HPV4_9FIRM|nr:SPOCS domain-containing protein [Thermosinus carboxydivorans]EAX48072.1 SH3, type 3 domain protein [Thermosinus carboxydivorans Nor1]